MKLKEVTFWLSSWRVEWIALPLQTITPTHRDFRHFTIRIPGHLLLPRFLVNIKQAIGEAVFGQWLDFDRFLVQLWKSCSVRPRVMYTAQRGVADCIGCLLPEVTKRGILNIVEY
jgi:hypothetical protein